MSRTITAYSVRDGWDTAPDPLPESYTDEPAELKKLGYDSFDCISTDDIGQRNLRIYRGKSDWLVSLDSPDTWENIACPDFGSVVELTAKLMPWLNGCMWQEFIDMARTLIDLLKDNEAAPLYWAERERRRRKHEEWERERLRSRAAKPNPAPETTPAAEG